MSQVGASNQFRAPGNTGATLTRYVFVEDGTRLRIQAGSTGDAELVTDGTRLRVQAGTAGAKMALRGSKILIYGV